MLERIMKIEAEKAKSFSDYQKGYKDGYEQGKDDGFKEGYNVACARYKTKDFYDPLGEEEK